MELVQTFLRKVSATLCRTTSDTIITALSASGLHQLCFATELFSHGATVRVCPAFTHSVRFSQSVRQIQAVSG